MRPKKILEHDVEAYLVKRVKALGGEVRKVRWEGRDGAPDRVVMLDRGGIGRACTMWAELKNPETVNTFPANAHERKQAREHARMRDMDQEVHVIGTFEQVDAMLL